MPILLALLGALAGGYFWMNRAQNAANMVGEIAGAAQNALGAARRFGFRRQANRHPVDCIEEANLAVGGLAVAFLELDQMPTAEQKNALTRGLQSALEITLKDAEEMIVLGHWFVQECQGAQAAVTRIAKRLNKLSGDDGLVKATAAIQHIVESQNGDVSDRQVDALSDIKRIFRAA